MSTHVWEKLEKIDGNLLRTQKGRPCTAIVVLEDFELIKGFLRKTEERDYVERRCPEPKYTLEVLRVPL